MEDSIGFFWIFWSCWHCRSYAASPPGHIMTHWIPHHHKYSLTVSRKSCISLGLEWDSCSRMAEMHFFLSLRPVGVNEYPGQSVPLNDHSHLKGLMVKSFASKWERPLSSRSKFSSHVLAKRPVSSRYTSTLSRPYKTSISSCTKSGEHLSPMGIHLYYFLKGVIITHSSWDSSSSNV